MDFETRSHYDVTTVGAFRYAEDPSTEVIIFGYAIDDGQVVVTDDLNDSRLDEVKEAVEIGAEFSAHNAQFERCLWRKDLYERQGWPLPKRSQWSCTAARAAARGYPRWLEGAAVAAKLGVNKDPEGKKLIRRFSMLDKKLGRFIAPAEDPTQWDKFKFYCGQDVVVERELDRVLPPLHPFEVQAYMLDSVMNETGFPIDTTLVQQAAAVVRVLDARLRLRGRELTVSEKNEFGLNPTQRDKLLEWLGNEGAELDTLQAQEIKDLLEDDTLPDHVREMLGIRLEASRASIKKLNAMLGVTCADGRCRGGFMYYGANTGRASGRLVQPHNFPRGDAKVQDPFLDVISLGDPDLLELMYPGALSTLAGSMRGFIATPPGKRFLVADYSAIEARILAWLAGQEDMLARYRAGADNYVVQASEVFGVPIADVTEEQRRIGKNLVLGCGYQMSGKRFPEFCKSQGVTVSAAFGERAVSKYRESVPHIVNLWKTTENAAVRAVRNGSREQVGKFAFRYGDDGALYAELPSGRSICYPEAHLEEMPYFEGTKSTVVYSREFKGQWVHESTYGGKLLENVDQGIARDLMVLGTLYGYRAGYPVVMTIHDELIAEVDTDDPRTAKDFATTICALPEWAAGLPLEAKGYTATRYKKG